MLPAFSQYPFPPPACLDAKSYYGFASAIMVESMDNRKIISDQMCSFVLGDSPLKLMFLGRPRRSDSSWLLEKAISVHDEDLLLLSLALPTVSLLSIGLLADGYGAVVVTLSFLFSKNRARDAFRA